jgi:peptidoglycan-associated lipoprotein
MTFAVASCAHRKPVQQEPVRPEQTSTSEPMQTTPVQTADDTFKTPPEPPNPLSGDIEEIDRRAHDEGWIRDAMFGYDAAGLDDAAQEALRQTATWLRAHPEFNVLIEGHCDERGTEQYNLALGDRRADAAVTFLAASGVDRTRMRTVSYGEERPFANGSSEEDWAQNRRAHVVLSGRR